ncbi:MAG: DUF2442 domain-containing protein [Bacteroidetes bacterium]|nr:DUF2442 domain-containing protein [Bacteroidota bacterium]
MNNFPKPIEVKALPDYRIWVSFTDGQSGEVSLMNLKGKGVFNAWDKNDLFSKVFVADNGRCIAWNEELEICPNSLYLDLIGKTFEEYASH